MERQQECKKCKDKRKVFVKIIDKIFDLADSVLKQISVINLSTVNIFIICLQKY